MHTIDLHELLVIGRLIFVGIFVKVIGLMAWRPSLGFFLRPLGVPDVITESNMLSDTMITKGRNLLTRHRGHPFSQSSQCYLREKVANRSGIIQ